MADEAPLEPGVPVLAETALEDRIARAAPVLVLFYADWCPFCEAFVPIYREIAPEAPLEAVAANLSHPEDPRWETYKVETIPTLVAYREGEEFDRLPGRPGEGLDRSDLEAFLAKLVESDLA